MIDQKWLDRITALVQIVLADTKCDPRLDVALLNVESNPEAEDAATLDFKINKRQFSTGLALSESDQLTVTRIASSLQVDVVGYERVQWPRCPMHPAHVIVASEDAPGVWQCPTSTVLHIDIGHYCEELSNDNS